MWTTTHELELAALAVKVKEGMALHKALLDQRDAQIQRLSQLVEELRLATPNPIGPSSPLGQDHD
jgi:hypothetical protein